MTNMSKFKKLHPENKEELMQISILAAFIVCLILLKPIVRLFLAYTNFCENLFN